MRWLVIVLTLSSAAVASSSDLHCDGTVGDAALRELRAIQIVTPIYPVKAIQSGIVGVAVADVCVHLGSQIAAVAIDSAPTESIATEMKRSLAQWRFKTPEVALGAAGAHSYGGKIIYYFVHLNNKWVVLEPRESFFLGPTFAKSADP
jgi:hypothetical protein